MTKDIYEISEAPPVGETPKKMWAQLILPSPVRSTIGRPAGTTRRHCRMDLAEGSGSRRVR